MLCFDQVNVKLPVTEQETIYILHDRKESY